MAKTRSELRNIAMIILYQIDIYEDRKVPFEIDEVIKENLQIDNEFVKDIVYGVTTYKDSLDEIANKYIDVIGNAITNVINNSEDPIETLRVITYILYTRKYVLPTATADVIKEFTNCQETDLENVNRLIYSIKIELCKDNFDKVNIEKMINESENGETPHISEESRKIAVKALLK